MQFMKNDHEINNIDIVSGDFHINSISAAHRFITPPYSYARYATEHKNDRLLYIASGRIKIDMYNNNPFIAKAGSAVYIPYNIAYKTEWLDGEQGEIYTINYVMTDIMGYQITMSQEILHLEKCNNRLLESLFMECYHTFNKAEYGYIIKCKYLFLKLIHTIISMQSEYSHSKIGKAIKYLDINFLGDVSIGELARMCNLGECMFRRCFKEETGLSPLKYKNRLRIYHAYELITKEAYSVAEAMDVTGFYDASYFNKTFKLYTGKSPSKCRTQK